MADPARPGDLFDTPAPDAAADVFAERLVAATIGAVETYAVYLGRRLGWYDALVSYGPTTSVELAARTSSNERYAREWLEHQAVSGYLTVDDAGSAATARRYALVPGAAEALTDVDSLAYTAPVVGFPVAAGRRIDDLVTAYRDGGGVSWARLGDDARTAQGAFNRPMFLHQLGQDVVPRLPDLLDLLETGARVADVGCGEGWSSIGLARVFARSTFEGFDVDAPSVAAATAHARQEGVEGRVSFSLADAAALSEHTGEFDVVTAFECVHDLPDPVAVLRAMRSAVRPGGYVLVMDERAAETFGVPGDPLERLLYGFSLLCCLPDGMSTPGGVGTGTVMRPDVLAGHATEAGFDRVEVLDVEHDFFRFYRLHP